MTAHPRRAGDADVLQAGTEPEASASGRSGIVISIPTALQELVPRPLLGRVFGIHHAVGYGLTSLSVAGAGLLATRIPVAALLAAAGAVFVACAALGALSRDLRELA